MHVRHMVEFLGGSIWGRFFVFLFFFVLVGGSICFFLFLRCFCLWLVGWFLGDFVLPKRSFPGFSPGFA